MTVILKLAGTVVIGIVLEARFLHWIDESSLLGQAIEILGGTILPLCLIPLVAFLGLPFLDWANATVNELPLFLRIGEDRLLIVRLDDESISASSSGSFSYEGRIVGSAHSLVDSVGALIREVTQGLGTLTSSPYVIFSSTQVLTEVEESSCVKVIVSAGAIDARHLPNCTSLDEVRKFVEDNPVQGLFGNAS
jgi:hypothetical protein